jgi:hypothetical protein
MELSEAREKLNSLNGASFLWRGKRFNVTAVKFSGVIRNYCIITDKRTFAHDHVGKFEAWLGEITVLNGTEQIKEFKPNNKQVMETETNLAVTAAAKNVATVTEGLLEAFNSIKANPTEENIKKGHALSSIANTMVNVGKLQVDILKLKTRQ